MLNDARGQVLESVVSTLLNTFLRVPTGNAAADLPLPVGTGTASISLVSTGQPRARRAVIFALS